MMPRRLDPADFVRVRNYALIQLLELAAPVQKLFADVWVRRRSTAPEQWRRGLLLGSHHIGDVLWTTSSIAALKQALPQCEWTYVASPTSAQVLIGNPNVADILVYDTFEYPIPSGIKKRLAALGFDAIVCTNRFRYERELRVGIQLRIPNRISYSNKGFHGWATKSVQTRGRLPYPAYFRELIADLVGLDPIWSLRPQIYPTARHEEEAKACIGGRGESREFYVLFNGARTSRNLLSTEVVLAVIRLLLVSDKADIILAGGREDAKDWESLAAQIGDARVRNIAGQMSLLGLACLLRSAKAVLTPDSGPRHLANAAGAPVVYLLPLDEQNATDVGPYLLTERAILEGRLDTTKSGIDPVKRANAIVAHLRAQAQTTTSTSSQRRCVTC